mgnify:CR=1 FL=1|jgi:hypothetical protein
MGNYDEDYDPDQGIGEYDSQEDLDMMYPNAEDDDDYC